MSIAQYLLNGHLLTCNIEANELILLEQSNEVVVILGGDVVEEMEQFGDEAIGVGPLPFQQIAKERERRLDEHLHVFGVHFEVTLGHELLDVEEEAGLITQLEQDK